MTELVAPDAEAPVAEPDADVSDSAEAVAERVRAQGERIRRRELETALQRLEARGAVSPEERRVLDRLAARITAGLVERWTARLADDGVDPEIALELLEDGE